ncbi:MAG: FAD-dependent oxidoreductase [Psychroflexus sp.]|uniref:FAD-dependent oxidoreductase n=1 Tax=Psychroflexus sp. S27 TaxID=1982757 RepID=UPI000C296F0C|nr:NAD(P)/FAD-dependent oxidoreductase [Psychroflexus sp. S27]PJX23239.1 kynurenine 3-monooxygenase [Psychroflexus sp. S27]
MKNREHLLIIGAGLCGSLLALRMAQHGYKITLVEKRPDLRKEKLSAGRSINLAFSDRAYKAFQLVGLHEKVAELFIPMHGRMLHSPDSETFLSKYSGRDNEYINSISRTDLNALLLNEVEKFDNVNIIFSHSCQHLDLENSIGVFFDEKNQQEINLKADYIFGTDGAGSAVRQSMQAQKDFLFSHSQEFLTHAYKELRFPPNKNNDYAIEKNALHIWPRGENMLIALPNPDQSFTVTLFLAYEGGEYNFNNLTNPEIVEEYFRKVYPDAYEILPNLKTEFFENPTSPLGTVKCSPWYYNKSILMGDAAHAIVPFYGQGMNASFEDVFVFDECLHDQNFDLDKTFVSFSKKRKEDADAIANLALDNFYEMKSHTAQDLFLRKRKIELALEKEFPEAYASKYSLVTFKEEIPYKEAMEKGRAQDKAILSLLKHEKLNEHQSLEEQLKLINKTTQQLREGDFLLEN